jgi:methyltransferase (TIGR00027 family)
MDEGRSSSTAGNTAFWRAAESAKPEKQRVCYDPIAINFLPRRLRNTAKSWVLRNLSFRAYERQFPGAIGNIVVRTRYIDDYLKACIADGIEQLVILGAGYDSRAYRFDELKGRVKVFEVDHPSTQKTKMQIIRVIFDPLPSYLVYVPVDFEKDDLGEKLSQGGYDKSLKTLFIWEGVTMYLTAQAIDATLGFVAANSGKGSSIVFDYYFRSAIDGTSRNQAVMNLRKSAELLGEPFSFGIEEGTAEEFLSKRGFYQVKNVTSQDLKKAYFEGRNRKREVAPFQAVVSATVKPRE